MADVDWPSSLAAVLNLVVVVSFAGLVNAATLPPPLGSCAVLALLIVVNPPVIVATASARIGLWFRL